jgi:hypothetical protein
MHVVDNSASRGVMTKWCGNLEVTCTRIAGSSERDMRVIHVIIASVHTPAAPDVVTAADSPWVIRYSTRDNVTLESYLEPFERFPCTDAYCIAHLGTHWFRCQNIQFTIPIFSFCTVSPCHGRLPRKLGFNPKHVHAGLMVDKKTVG